MRVEQVQQGSEHSLTLVPLVQAPLQEGNEQVENNLKCHELFEKKESAEMLELLNRYLHAQNWRSMLINVVDNLLQCCAAPCQQCYAAPCQQLLSTTIVHSCSRSTVIVQSLFNHCWQPSTSFSHQLLSAQFQQHCNNYCSLSTSNNYWSNNTHQHCEFNKCCWILITTLFRRCSTNKVASTWSIFARVLLMFLCKRGILETQWTKFWGSFEWGSGTTCVNSFFV